MPQTSGRSMTLVASSRPPRPTSRMQASAGVRAKARKATAVVDLEEARLDAVAGVEHFARARRRARSSSISLPAIRMRSLKRTRCGLVNMWTVWPAASSAARRKAQVEPLPLVPATWKTGGSASCGRPSRSSNCGDAVEAEPVAGRGQQREAVELGLDCRDAPSRRNRPSGRGLLRREIGDQLRQSFRAAGGAARPCRSCHARADIRRAGSPRAASRGWSARSPAGRRSRSARRARRSGRRRASHRMR